MSSIRRIEDCIVNSPKLSRTKLKMHHSRGKHCSLWPHFHKQISVELNRQMCTVS